MSLSPDAPLPRLLLASISPRRAQLLNSIGVAFEVARSEFREPAPSAEDARQPAAYVERLARGKADGCVIDHRRLYPPDVPLLVLGADTVVWREGEILNKPRDEAEARDMLYRLQGKEHRVYTGVCLRLVSPYNKRDDYKVEHEVTRVKFRPASETWIARYVRTGEPMDKAGAYAAQGLSAVLIERLEGDYSNVVGLPLCRLSRMLEACGAPVERYWS